MARRRLAALLLCAQLLLPRARIEECAAGWAGDDCDACAAGFSGDLCDQAAGAAPSSSSSSSSDGGGVAAAWRPAERVHVHRQSCPALRVHSWPFV
jgi:hypothetical protein